MNPMDRLDEASRKLEAAALAMEKAAAALAGGAGAAPSFAPGAGLTGLHLPAGLNPGPRQTSVAGNVPHALASTTTLAKTTLQPPPPLSTPALPLRLQGHPPPPPPSTPPPLPSRPGGAAWQATRDRLFPDKPEGRPWAATNAMNAFARAAYNPIGALDKLAAGGGYLAKAAGATAASLRVLEVGAVSAVAGLYSLRAVMAAGAPNASGQLEGSLNLISTSVANALTPLSQLTSSVAQRVSRGEIGGGIGHFFSGLPGALMGVPDPTAKPSMKGLPEARMSDSAADFYDQGMLKSLTLGAGTVESEVTTRQLEAITGLLREVANNTRDTIPGFR